MRLRTSYAFLLSLVFLSIQLLGCGGNNAAIMIGGSLPATGTVGAGYLGTLTATGGSGSYMWTVGGLPAGVMASGTATATLTVSGTPTTAGTSAFTATVTDSKGHTATFSVSIVISAATQTITITGSLPATGTVGTAYTGSLTASGGTAPYMWVVTGLPAGVTPSGIATPTVTASGTPTTAGTSAVSATVTDANTHTATFTVSVVISAAAASLSVRLPAGYPLTATVGVAYSAPAPTATGGTPPYTFAVVQNAVPGLTINSSTGAVTGTPTTAGTFKPTIQVTDSATPPNSGQTNFTIVVSPSGTIAIAGSLPTTGTVGDAYTGSLTASGGTAPYMWVVTGLPAGITPSGASTATVTASGTPTTAGTSAVSATVTDANTHTATFTTSVVISAAAANLSVNLPAGYPLTATVGTAYSAPAVTATGGTPPYTFTVAQNAVPGLTIDSTTGAITGTPTTAGTFKPTIQVTDSATPPNSGQTNFTIVVSATTANACPAGTNNAALAAAIPYAFLLRGSDGSNAAIAIAGSFTPDGNGNVTAAEVDYNGVTNGPQHVTAASGTYSFGTDQRGCLSLTYAGANASAPATAVFNFSLGAFDATNDAQAGHIVEFDNTGTGIVAAGEMYLQNIAQFDHPLLPNYAFGVTGVDALGNHTVIAGNLGMTAAANGTAITSAFADINNPNFPSGELTGGSGSLTSFSLVDGRGTGTTTIPFGAGQNLTFSFTVYLISDSNFFIISTDPIATVPLLSGQAIVTQQSFTAAQLNGFYLLAVEGLNKSVTPAANDATIGIANFQGNGDVTVNLNEYNAGTATNTVVMGNYTVDPSVGRVSFTNTGQNPPVIYLTVGASGAFSAGVTGFAIGTGTDASSGVIATQTTGVPNFSTSDIGGTFSFGSAPDISNLNGSLSGAYVITGASGAYTATVDVSNSNLSGKTPLLQSGAALPAGIFTVNSDGTGSINDANGDIFVTNGVQIFAIPTIGTSTYLYTFFH